MAESKQFKSDSKKKKDKFYPLIRLFCTLFNLTFIENDENKLIATKATLLNAIDDPVKRKAVEIQTYDTKLGLNIALNITTYVLAIIPIIITLFNTNKGDDYHYVLLSWTISITIIMGIFTLLIIMILNRMKNNQTISEEALLLQDCRHKEVLKSKDDEISSLEKDLKAVQELNEKNAFVSGRGMHCYTHNIRDIIHHTNRKEDCLTDFENILDNLCRNLSLIDTTCASVKIAACIKICIAHDQVRTLCRSNLPDTEKHRSRRNSRQNVTVISGNTSFKTLYNQDRHFFYVQHLFKAQKSDTIVLDYSGVSKYINLNPEAPSQYLSAVTIPLRCLLDDGDNTKSCCIGFLGIDSPIENAFDSIPSYQEYDQNRENDYSYILLDHLFGVADILAQLIYLKPVIGNEKIDVFVNNTKSYKKRDMQLI